MVKSTMNVCLLSIFIFLLQQTVVNTTGIGVKQLFYRESVSNPYVLGITGSRKKISSGSTVIVSVQKNVTTSTSISNTAGESTHQGWIGLEGGETRINISASEVIDVEASQQVILLQVASLFRNNIIKAFGYILHRTNMELDSALYTSLYFIWNTIKLNQVNIVGMVSILSEISFKTSKDRFLKIFESMEQHLPDYLKCSATYWKEAIKKKTVNMDTIFKPTKNGPLVVDVLDKITKEMLDKVSKKAEEQKPANKEEEKILFNFNINILQIMKYIRNNKKDIKQEVLGALLEHFPRTFVKPDLEESIMVITQYLNEAPIDEWELYVGGVNKAENPYTIVKTIFDKLLGNINLPFVIKDSLQMVLVNLFDRNPTAINPHYVSITQIVNLTNIDLQHMLLYVQKGAFPTEIVYAAQRVSHYLSKAYIRHLTLFLHINPYLYSSPTEIFIAILSRIVYRQPDLANEILDSAGAVFSYWSVTYRYTATPAVMPDDMQNINLLILGFRAPDIEASSKDAIEKVIIPLQELEIDYEKVLNEKVKVHKCSTPVLCFMELLSMLLQLDFLNSEIKADIPSIGNTNCSCGRCDVLPAITPLYSKAPNEDTTTTTPITTTLTTPTEGPPQTPTTLKPTEATTPTAPSPSTKKDETTPNPDLGKPAKGNDMTVIELFGNITREESQDVRITRIILEVLNSAEYKTKFEKSESLALIAHFQVALEMAELKTAEIHDKELVARFRKFIANYMSTLIKVKQILVLISREEQPTRPILNQLIIAVPAPITDEEKKKFNTLKLLLGQQELFEIIAKGVKREEYKNVGVLLKAVLTAEAKLTQKLTKIQLDVINYYLGKIEMHGFGQTKVFWGVNITEIERNVNIGYNMNNALGFAKLDGSKKNLFNNIIRHLKKHPEIAKGWGQWIYYRNSGEFTSGLFQQISKEASLSSNVKKAIDQLTPLINTDGDALKPIF